MYCKYQTILILILFFTLCVSALADKNKPVNIGIVYDGSSERNADLLQELINETRELIAGEYNVQFDDKFVKTADYTIAGIEKAFENLMNDKEVDIVITLGLLSSQVACLRESYAKPVIAAYIFDYAL